METAWQMWLSVRLEKQKVFFERRMNRQQQQQQQSQSRGRSLSAFPSGGSGGGSGSTTRLAQSHSAAAAPEEEEDTGSGGGGGTPTTTTTTAPTTLVPAAEVHMEGHSDILSKSQVKALEGALPGHHQGYKWVLLYSIRQQGASLLTLFNRTRRQRPTLVVLRDSGGGIFGGFATDAWVDRAGKGSDVMARALNAYYGDGESFVFSVKEDGDVMRYRWTGNNFYFQVSNRDGLGMGGGGGFAWFVDGDLAQGSSGECDTFGTPPEGLSSSSKGKGSFDCVDFEVWGFKFGGDLPPPPCGVLSPVKGASRGGSKTQGIGGGGGGSSGGSMIHTV